MKSFENDESGGLNLTRDIRILNFEVPKRQTVLSFSDLLTFRLPLCFIFASSLNIYHTVTLPGLLCRRINGSFELG